jgi:hypothetical protein
MKRQTLDQLPTRLGLETREVVRTKPLVGGPVASRDAVEELLGEFDEMS